VKSQTFFKKREDDFFTFYKKGTTMGRKCFSNTIVYGRRMKNEKLLFLYFSKSVFFQFYIFYKNIFSQIFLKIFYTIFFPVAILLATVNFLFYILKNKWL